MPARWTQSAPDNPVFIMHQGGHFGSANTMALNLAGINKDTPDPMGGIIERDKDGNPNGAFYNHRSMDMLRKAIPMELMTPDPAGLRTNQDLMVEPGNDQLSMMYMCAARISSRCITTWARTSRCYCVGRSIPVLGESRRYRGRAQVTELQGRYVPPGRFQAADRWASADSVHQQAARGYFLGYARLGAEDFQGAGAAPARGWPPGLHALHRRRGG